MPLGNITYAWRAPFTNGEIHALHAAAFETRLFDESEWDWVEQTKRFSLGWVVARDGRRFVEDALQVCGYDAATGHWITAPSGAGPPGTQPEKTQPPKEVNA